LTIFNFYAITHKLLAENRTQAQNPGRRNILLRHKAAFGCDGIGGMVTRGG
jgi:hypothetical protein